jgi:hypothetical protein
MILPLLSSSQVFVVLVIVVVVVVGVVVVVVVVGGGGGGAVVVVVVVVVVGVVAVDSIVNTPPRSQRATLFDLFYLSTSDTVPVVVIEVSQALRFEFASCRLISVHDSISTNSTRMPTPESEA